MHRFLVILSCVAAAYAGVGVVTPEIEAEALRLWQAYCDGASDAGTDGNTFIYCKKSRDVVEENLQHTLELKPSENAAEQVVFVQPPSYHYKHDVVVSGGGGSAPKTVIYVKPAKNTNEVNIVDQTQPGGAPQKPTLYFLKGNHGGDADAAGGARARRDDVAVNGDLADGQQQEENLNVNPYENPRKPVVYILKTTAAEAANN